MIPTRLTPMRDGFGAFILTHGRPHAVQTVRALHRGGYTGPWWLVLDDEDDTREEYEREWGAERILVFTKDDTAQDMADNGGSRSVVLYARNAVDPFAQALGLTHYMVLDDDYTGFYYRHRQLRPDGAGIRLGATPVRSLDAVLDAMVDFLDTSGALTVAFAQGGDLLGGHDRTFFNLGLSRKAMNLFICRTGRPVRFVGRINEDVNTYVTLGNRGELMFTVTTINLTQGDTQQQAGGMTPAYAASGTYRKSFYTVMMAPSCVKVWAMGSAHYRYHHRVTWNQTVPKILSGRWQRQTERETAPALTPQPPTRT